MTGQNGSGQDGNTVLTGEAGKTRVAIDLKSSPAGPQPVHIHQGTCANLGPVFGIPNHAFVVARIRRGERAPPRRPL